MSADQIRTIVRRFYDEVVNGRDADAARELIADDIVFQDPAVPGGVLHGRAEVQQFIEALVAAFPDFHMSPDGPILVEDTTAVCRWVARGTHRGEFAGQPPTGRQISVPGIDLFTITEGRIAQMWVALDTLSMMQQLGAVPTPA
jgi:steroid delta-isomerase-like uncharacterized protein